MAGGLLSTLLFVPVSCLSCELPAPKLEDVYAGRAWYLFSRDHDVIKIGPEFLEQKGIGQPCVQRLASFDPRLSMNRTTKNRLAISIPGSPGIAWLVSIPGSPGIAWLSQSQALQESLG